jgi:hypothetical protein
MQITKLQSLCSAACIRQKATFKSFCVHSRGVDYAPWARAKLRKPFVYNHVCVCARAVKECVERRGDTKLVAALNFSCCRFERARRLIIT